MDAMEILNRLAERRRPPIEALEAASADRVAAVPVFLDAIERYLSSGSNSVAPGALFFIFHLLGEWREKSAYRPLARLLRQPPDDVDAILGGAITETTHRVMAAVFDGDPDPLYQIIRDAEADEFIRSRMCEALAMVTFHGGIPRAEAARFLEACYADLAPQDECFVWQGWQSAIALLGLVELKPMVEQVFTRGLISLSWLSFEHFEGDLRQTLQDPAGLPHRSQSEFSLFGDTIEELSRWYCFSSEGSSEPSPVHERKPVLSVDQAWRPSVPARNPQRKLGRNDPCLCGSGKKFKKCCLAKQYDRAAVSAA